MGLKWLFVIVGLIFGGPVGATIGFVIGFIVDNIFSYKDKGRLNKNIESLTILSAAVMKADGRVTKPELDYVKQFFRQLLGNDDTTKTLLIFLRDLLEQDIIPINNACKHIGLQTSYSERLKIINYLFGIAQSNDTITEDELRVLEAISLGIGLSQSAFWSIKSMYTRNSYQHSYNTYVGENTDNLYKTLGIQPTATNKQVKEAYKQMVIKHHPDKVSHKGAKHQKEAEEQIKKINSAYHEIKKIRDIR